MALVKTCGKVWCIEMSSDNTQLWWAIESRSDNWLDGLTSHLVRDWMTHTDGIRNQVKLFDTRQLARTWNEKVNGYIRYRPDLLNEPHGWKMPRVVRVEVTIKVVGIK
jgi:hypothetical protein